MDGKNVKKYMPLNAYKLVLSCFVFFILFGISVKVFATPPTTQYNPAETLNPTCVPGSTNCSVAAGSGWGLTGNAGTTPGTDFIGTTDMQDFVIKVNNTQVGRITSSDNGNSIYLGLGAGGTVSNAVFIGENAGLGTMSATRSNIIGLNAGYNAWYANDANFIGNEAGKGANNAPLSNFIGKQAGLNAANAAESIFIGDGAGKLATDASYSLFLGNNTGQSAFGAASSNFIGAVAGSGAENAAYSNFIGLSAGMDAVNANNSIFIGNNAGNGDIVDNSATPWDYSILIGDETGTGGFSNSIALGKYATNTGSNQFMIGSTTRPINTLVLTGASGNTCVLDVTVASPSCSSDERLKTNITNLNSDVLDKVLQIKTVSYNWLNYPEKSRQIGFLAQDLEQYFPEIVSNSPGGFKTVSYGGMTPILVQAIRELNLKIEPLESLDTNTTGTLGYLIKNFLASSANMLENIFTNKITTKQICVDENTCLNEADIRALIETAHNNQNTTPANVPVTTENTITDTQIPTPDNTQNTTENTTNTTTEVPVNTDIVN